MTKSIDPVSFLVSRIEPLIDRTYYNLFLFGSYARGDFDNASDIDIAIQHKKWDLVPNALLSRIRDICDDFPRNVDIVDIHSLHWRVLSHMKEYMKKI